MAETKTLSKIEQAALLGAQRQMGHAQAEMNAIIAEVAKAHKIDPKKDGNDWVFSPDFSRIEYRPRPKPEKDIDRPDGPPGLAPGQNRGRHPGMKIPKGK